MTAPLVEDAADAPVGVAVAQFAPTADTTANIAAIAALVERARARGADVGHEAAGDVERGLGLVVHEWGEGVRLGPGPRRSAADRPGAGGPPPCLNRSSGCAE